MKVLDLKISSQSASDFHHPNSIKNTQKLPILAFLLSLSCSLSFSPSTCRACVMSLDMFIFCSTITFLHSVFTMSDTPCRIFFIWALEMATMWGVYQESWVNYSLTLWLSCYLASNSWTSELLPTSTLLGRTY